MRLFRDFLISNQYEIEWLERPEGHSWGLWRANIDRILEFCFPNSSSDIGHLNQLKINDYELFQNYPNPFNPVTNIRYSVGDRQFVTLKVYDILGKEIATLVNEEKPSGNYQVSFQASDISSGFYYYQLRAGEYIEAKQMILLK